MCPKDQNEKEVLNLLNTISINTMFAVQWIPSYCEIPGNEEADKLAKAGRDEPQHNPPVPYSEAKGIIKKIFKKKWKGTILQKMMLGHN